MMIKALVFDIDGTLTVKKNEMSSTLRDKLQNLREQGMQIIMATGRPVTDLMEFQKENCFFTPAVILNGAAVLNDGEMSCCQYLQRDCVSRIMEQLVAQDLPFVCYQKESNVVIDSSRGSYANVMQHYLPEANLQSLFESFVSYKADTFDKEKVLKIETCFPDLQQIAHVREQLLTISGINVVRSMHFNLEMSDQQANKGKKLLEYIHALGIQKEEVLVFGDSENDISMFDVFPHSVWVNNRQGHVLRAQYETNPCYEDGVYQFLEDYFK